LPWQVVHDDALGALGLQMPDGKWLCVFFESLESYKRYAASLQTLLHHQMRPMDVSRAASPSPVFFCAAALVMAVLGALVYIILRRG
jgi:hypothetical protein